MVDLVDCGLHFDAAVVWRSVSHCCSVEASEGARRFASEDRLECGGEALRAAAFSEIGAQAFPGRMAAAKAGIGWEAEAGLAGAGSISHPCPLPAVSSPAPPTGFSSFVLVLVLDPPVFSRTRDEHEHEIDAGCACALGRKKT